MKYRKLGCTKIEVSEIGFGAWGIGGLSNGPTSYGKTNDEDSIAALRFAFDSGINFFDTSDLYGYGHSERLIGRVFKNMRKKIVIASKVGFLEHNGPYDFSPKHIKEAIELSLRRLQTDYLDLYQLHSPPIDLVKNDERIMAALINLKEQGKIRSIGISVKSPQDGFTALELGFECIQVNFNLIDQRAIETGLFDECERRMTGIIVRTPLCFGFLTGKYPQDIKFDSTDHRSTWSAEQIKQWSSAYKIFIDAISVKNKLSPVDFALKFCLSFKTVSSVIPGMLNEKEVTENLKASKGNFFSQAQISKIRQIYQNNNFFLGKLEK